MRMIVEGTPAELAEYAALLVGPPPPGSRRMMLDGGGPSPLLALPAAAPKPLAEPVLQREPVVARVPPRMLDRCPHATLPVVAGAVADGHHPSRYRHRDSDRVRWVCVACGAMADESWTEVDFGGTCAQTRARLPGAVARVELTDGVRWHLAACARPW